MKSGDPCCPGHVMRVYGTKRLPGDRLAVRYLRCTRPACPVRGRELVPVSDLRNRTLPEAIPYGAKKSADHPRKRCPTRGLAVTESANGRIMKGRQSPKGDAEMLQTFQEVCDQLRIDEPTCWRLLRDGLLPKPIVLDDLVRWPAMILREWIADGCPAVGEPIGNSRKFCETQVAVELEWLAQLDDRIAAREAAARFSEKGVDDAYEEAAANLSLK